MIEEREEACDSFAIEGDEIPFIFDLNTDYSPLDWRTRIRSWSSIFFLLHQLSPWTHMWETIVL